MIKIAENIVLTLFAIAIVRFLIVVFGRENEEAWNSTDEAELGLFKSLRENMV